ncbi:SOS response-associated peptidase family protein [Curvibacter sp. HBC61]|uniref:Abasic site processing protein n=1 Tax=Curvibacter cyanobacteriorum TaxID=3026422 RepID=A0ABT5MSG8_9BURK|nr:SOS response-associated peptidase family protein [Curvibacter sp. HBC61]MDD0836982.1 SOS response-associated peptidase family protein [Curvibacter sp. HBC61]
MTVQFESVHAADLFPLAFGVPAPEQGLPRTLRPRMVGAFICRELPAVAAAADPSAPRAGDPVTPAAGDPVVTSAAAPSLAGAAGEAQPPSGGRVLRLGQFGLVPSWVKSASDARLRSPKLVNARSETVSTSNNFREAWLNAQRCIVPMMAFFEDDLRSGQAVSTRIARVDGKPMGVAGLWAQWNGPGGEPITSFTLLTVNANSHALMHRYQHPGTEKRMPAILNEGAYEAWLTAPPDKAREFMRAYPANWLLANPVQKGK